MSDTKPKPMSVEEAMRKLCYAMNHHDGVQEPLLNLIAAVEARRDEHWRAKMMALAEKWRKNPYTDSCNPFSVVESIERLAKEPA